MAGANTPFPRLAMSDEEHEIVDPPLAAHVACSGEAALQLVELILFALIDRKIVSRDDMVAEIESLASEMPTVDAQQRPLTVRGRLIQVANSLMAMPEDRDAR